MQHFCVQYAQSLFLCYFKLWCFYYWHWTYNCLLDFTFTPANIYLFKVHNRNTGKRCEIWSKLLIKTSKRRHWRLSGVLIVNSEQMLLLFLVFIVDCEQVNICLMLPFFFRYFEDNFNLWRIQYVSQFSSHVVKKT